jgi:uncharacterized hydrophobic protein (TIGR00271 family)
VLTLRVLAPPGRGDDVVATLDALDGVVNIVVVGVTRDGGEGVITADVAPGAADELFARLGRLDIDAEAIVLVRQSAVGPVARRRPGKWFDPGQHALVWAEAVDTARENAMLTTRYCLYMVAAGVIATCGIVLKNSILIVGAMAVSPDLLPLSAFSVGLVGRRPWLATRGFTILCIGLAIAGGCAAVLTWALRAMGAYNGLLSSGNAMVGLVAEVTPDTIIVAFAAGVVGMLAFETRASAAVGVAISVTTIPAVAFAGVAIGVAAYGQARSALWVLLVNVVILFLGGVLTLLMQRLFGRRYA